MSNISENSDNSSETYFSGAEKDGPLFENGTQETAVPNAECHKCIDRQALEETRQEMLTERVQQCVEQVQQIVEQIRTELYSEIRQIMYVNLRSMCEALDKRIAKRINENDE